MDILEKIYLILDSMNKQISSNRIDIDRVDLDDKAFNRILKIMYDANLITGLDEVPDGDLTIMYETEPLITLDGIEYLTYYQEPEKFIERIKNITKLVKQS